MGGMDFIRTGQWIIERLKKDIPALKAVEHFTGQIESGIEQMPLKSPAAFVAYRGSEYKWIDGPNYEENPAFSVLLVVRSLKPEDTGQGPGGAYGLIKVILASLTNSRPSVDMEMLQPTGSQLVFHGMDFKTGFDTTYQW